MRHNPFDIVQHFEETVADYCDSTYAVATDSCTSAIFLCCEYMKTMDASYQLPTGFREIVIPSLTYISPALSIMHSGHKVVLDKKANDWSGIYQLKPYPIYDAAKRLTSKMYLPGTMMCLSFHIKKHLKLGKGGMILTDNLEARDWFRKASYEGRSRDKGIYVDEIYFPGWNMYMAPQTAANGLAMMQNYPLEVPDLPNHYRDLTTFNVFRQCKVI